MYLEKPVGRFKADSMAEVGSSFRTKPREVESFSVQLTIHAVGPSYFHRGLNRSRRREERKHSAQKAVR